MRVSGRISLRWSCVPALTVLALLAGPVPAQAAAPLPDGCKADGNTITCGSLKDGDVVEGTGGDDTILIKGDVPQGAAVHAGAGNDTITVYDVGGFDCSGGIGAQAKKGGEVDAGPGDDTIVVGTGARDQACRNKIGSEIPLGNVSERGNVIGGPGDDKITVGTLGYISSDKDHPEKSLEVIAGRISGNDGDDVIDVGWVATGAHFNDPETADGVYGGQGADTMHAGNVNGLGLMSGGPGPDTLTVDGMNTGYVEGNDGDDKIFATKGPLMGLAKLNGNAGNDELTVTSLEGTTAAMGDEGDDIIRVTNINGPGEKYPLPGLSASSADGGPGNDTITVDLIGNSGGVLGGEGDDTINVKSVNGPEDVIRGDGDELKYHNSIINGWAGNDKITVGFVGKLGQVWGDGYPDAPVRGKDIIKVTDLDGQAKVRGGPLADRITVANLKSKQNSVNGEGGNDIITVTGTNNGSVIGGAGTGDKCTAKGSKKTCELPKAKPKKKKK
ncbi:hypothetical protein ACFYO1_23395 [Nocardia sp. NPDC006044]|uniref:hypothetical protein n=1 Tax=Nocardia sp. NPDC006044 TaxID=3364306 RepID=UPI0036915F8B